MTSCSRSGPLHAPTDTHEVASTPFMSMPSSHITSITHTHHTDTEAKQQLFPHSKVQVHSMEPSETPNCETNLKGVYFSRSLPPSVHHIMMMTQMNVPALPLNTTNSHTPWKNAWKLFTAEIQMMLSHVDIPNSPTGREASS